MKTLTAAVSNAATEPFALEELEIGSPRADEVLVAPHYAGICNTDISCHRGRTPTPQPVVLGHEGAGTVVEVGSNVHDVAPGDRVLMTFMSCGHCRPCMTGRPSYCLDALKLNFLGGRADGTSAYETATVHGHFFGQSSFATLSMANARNVIRVPDGVPLESAAVLGCGVMTGAGTVLRSLQVTPGSKVAVFGAGTVGISAVMAARLAGASVIVAVDAVKDRLSAAAQLGATNTVLAGEEDVLEIIAALTEGGVDFSVEASGNSQALLTAIDCLGFGGACAAVGMVNESVAPSWRALRLKGATIRGVVEGDANPQLFLPELLRYHNEGRFPFDQLITLYQFGEINEAVADAEHGRVVKPVLDIAGKVQEGS